MISEEELAAALRILHRLQEQGYEAYLAGGCVRDLLLGRTPHDYDVATSATPDVVLAMFPRTFAVGAHFVVVLVADEDASEPAAPQVPQVVLTEVATFRADGVYSDGRHPDGVRYTLSAEEDVQRRDFTINGLLLDPLAFEGEFCFPPFSAESTEKDGVPGTCGAANALRDPQVCNLAEVRSPLRGSGARLRLSQGSASLHPGLSSCGPSGAFAAQDDGLWSEDDPVQSEEDGDHGEDDPDHDEDDGLRREDNLATFGKRQVLKGHDFSRAVRDSKQPWALAPEGGDFGTFDFHHGLLALKKHDSLTGDALSSDAARLRAAVVDHVGGLADLDAGVVRAIGRPEARLEEDHLRMLRAVRFAARFGFSLEPATGQAIRALAPRIASVSRERVRDELTKMLTEGHARQAFELLLATGLLAQVLPEVEKMVGVEQPPQFHPEGDVWQHTLLLLEQLEAGCPMTLGWGALLHDVGKPATFKRAVDRIRFDGHVDVGVAIAAEVCRRFRFSNEETRQTLALVENHMRFMDVQRMKDSTLKRMFRLERFEEHLALHRMDCLASKGDLENWEYARTRWQAMPPEVVRPTPLITGRELIGAGYQPGAEFKAMLDAVEEAQLEGTIVTAEEALALVRARFGPAIDPALR